MADIAPPHGYVEPCALHFVVDGTKECEQCSPTHENPGLCNDTLGKRGYVRECQTKGHSAPSEVWCVAKQSGGAAAYAPYVAGLAAFSALLGAFMFLKRRRRTGK
jgi:hypothetical protein